MFVFLKSWVHDSMAVWTIETIICFTLSSFSTYVNLLNRYMKMGMHCVWHSGWMLKPCRSMLSPFPLMCWNKQNFFLETWLQRPCLKWTDMAMTFRFVYYTSALNVLEKCHSDCPFITKTIQAHQKSKKNNNKTSEHVWEHPKVFALMLLWNENLYDFGTIRTNEYGDVAALCRHLKSPLLLFCFIIFLCATTVNDWCWLCKWARGKKHG